MDTLLNIRGIYRNKLEDFFESDCIIQLASNFQNLQSHVLLRIFWNMLSVQRPFAATALFTVYLASALKALARQK